MHLSTYFIFEKAANDQRGDMLLQDVVIPLISEMKRQPKPDLLYLFNQKITVAISFVLLQANRAQHFYHLADIVKTQLVVKVFLDSFRNVGRNIILIIIIYLS